MGRRLGDKPQRRFTTELADVLAARLHRYCIAQRKERSDVVASAICAYLDRSEREVDLASLPDELNDQLNEFCAAHFAADRNVVIAAAIGNFITSELRRDAATRERFERERQSNAGGDMLQFPAAPIEGQRDKEGV